MVSARSLFSHWLENQHVGEEFEKIYKEIAKKNRVTPIDFKEITKFMHLRNKLNLITLADKTNF